MSGVADSAVVLTRPARRLVIERGGPLERGLREHRPKRLNYAKLIATLLRQLIDKDPKRPLAAATVLVPLVGGDAETILDLLPDVPRLTLGAPLFPTALDQIQTLAGRTALVVVGDAEPPEGDSHAALARALVTHDRKREQKLAERLLHVPPSPEKRECLVIEERPGKASILDLSKATHKSMVRRFEASKELRDGTRAPLFTPPGWGAGGLVLSDDLTSPTGRQVSVASLDWRPPGGGLNLDTMKVLKHSVDNWLQSLDLDPDSLKRLVVSAPGLSVSGFIGAGLTARDIVAHPDQLFGWQPLMTLLGFLYEPGLPALLVYSGRHPTVHLVAMWS